MTLQGLAAKNLLRNPLRTGLTVAGVSVAVLTFLLLRTVIWSYNVAADFAVKDRVYTRHKVTFVMTLPRRYVDDAALVKGVRKITWANWFGGKEPNHPNDFFMSIAVDQNTYLDVFDEMVVPEDQKQAWKEDRIGVIVGDAIAKKMGWKVGDKIMIQSQIFSGDWEFHVSGIYTATSKSVDRSQFLFHWDYFNERVSSDAFRDQIGWIVTRVDGDPAAFTKRMDDAFDSKDTQTLSQDESTFQRAFLAGFSAILKAINVISVVILSIMMMILGNTVAMGVRERTGEYGVLRAMGFLPRHLTQLVLGEAAVLGILGGLGGLVLAYPIVQWGIGRFIEENMGGMFPYFRIGSTNAILGVVLSFALSAVAAGLPAYQATKFKVVDALRRVA